MSESKTPQLVEIHQRCEVFFKEQLDGAFARQHISISQESAFYLLVIMSLGLKTYPGLQTQSLAERYLAAQREERPDVLRDVGDLSLIIAGIWWQSLARRLVDVDYYIILGRLSYKMVSEMGLPVQSDLFEELSQNFLDLVNVLMEASQCVTDAVTSNRDILRMYEVWQRTRNDLLAAKLRSLGINVIPVGETARFIH